MRMTADPTVPPAPRRRPLPLLVAAAAALASALAACAHAEKSDKMVWPFPPDTPRIRHVRTIKGTADFDHSIARKIFRALTGAKGLALHNPAAAAVSPDDRTLYVSCPSIGLVLAFELDTGKVRRAADTEGSRPKHPWGLAVDGDQNLYVTDQAERVVWVYSPSGKFLRQLGKGMFDRPTGIAIDRRRQLVYVVDGSGGQSDRHRIQVFAPSGKHLRTIGTRGPGPGQFNFASMAAVSPEGNLYVSDTGNFRIQIFDPEGRLVTTHGDMGYGPGMFAKVKGLAFDSFGDLHAVDSDATIVQMFNSKLKPLMAYGGLGDKAELFTMPGAIAIDSKNNIFVTDYMKNVVQQYQLFNTTAADTVGPPAADAAAPPAGRTDAKVVPSTGP